MRQTIRFELNQPVTVALEFPEGVRVAGHYGPQVKFFLTEERVMYAVPDLADAIRILGVKPEEPFTITKRWETGKKPWWDLERIKSPSKAVENSETPQTTTPPPKNESSPVSATQGAILSAVPDRKTPQKGTHIQASAPPPHSGMHLTRTPPLKPSYEEAFRECLRIVTTGLGDAREQWSDSAKQAMVSTLLIQLGRENRLGEFRPQPAAKVA